MEYKVTMSWKKNTKHKDVFVSDLESVPVENVYVNKSYRFDPKKPITITISQED